MSGQVAVPAADRRRGRGESGRVVAWLVAILVVVVAITGAAAYLGYLPDLFDDPTGTATESPGTQSPELPEPPTAVPGLSLDPLPASRPVLEPVAAAELSPAKVRAALRDVVRDRSLGNHLGLVVEPLDSDTVLSDPRAATTVTPASTLKLLTCLAALQTMGPEHTFETTVAEGRTRRELVLVGGGDPLLTTDRLPAAEADSSYPAAATLEDLAVSTARAVKARGLSSVSLSYDASLFSGPAVNPAWEPDYIPEFVVSPISALWVDEGRAVPGLAQRVADPAAEAARRFAELLTARGVNVKPSVTSGEARPGARTVASVSSAPLADIVQHVLELSDNEGAEVLLRHVGLASNRAGSSKAGAAAVQSVLGELGIALPGARIFDGSGLSRDDRLPVEALVDVLQVASDPAHPELRTVVSGLPVAGFTGSLDYRFVADAPRGLGVVRAKTGTLTGVHGLAGLVITRDNQAMVFAAVADRVPVPRTFDARVQLELIATALATCRCAR